MIRDVIKGLNPKSIIKIIVFSEFIDASGPTPRFCYPNNLAYDIQMGIAMKSISLLMGEGVYQSGQEFDNLKYFGIVPFPDIDMVGLSYFFLIKDETARGKAKAATITVLVEEKNNQFFYDNIKTLRVLIDQTSQKLIKNMTEEEVFKEMNVLRQELINFDPSNLQPFRTTKRLKIIFTGLDNAGKTSFLRSIRNKYSELMGITPTKGVERLERDLLGTKLIEWDFGGQSNYRVNYFKNAELYLSDVDLLFYLIDVQDSKRVEENLSYLTQLLTTMETFKIFPPIIIVFHKYDPDISYNSDANDRISLFQGYIKKKYPDWMISFFNSTIFDHWSIVSAFSYGISLLSPNRELFRDVLKWLMEKIKGEAAILLSNNSIILSDYSKHWGIGMFFERTQSNFFNIFTKFQENDLIDSDHLLWEFGSLCFYLKEMEIENKKYYLLIQLKNKKSVDKIESYLHIFSQKITPILMDFF